MFRVSALALSLLVAATSEAAEYECPAVLKFSPDGQYSETLMKTYQYSTKLEELPEGTFISRCSYSTIEKKVTCDRYRVDRVDRDPFIGVKKYYVFFNQLDFQLFKGLSSVENNGRQSITFGKCRLVPLQLDWAN